MKTNASSRRRYAAWADLWHDLRWLFRQRGQLRPALRGRLVSPAFRERLMLAVTAVNQCRYCAFFHARESLRAGLSPAEIRRLQDGLVGDAPADELPALLYAQHWAEANGRPDPLARQHVLATYGPERTAAIETLLQLIRTGNLLGNTADWLLRRLSRGRR